MIVSDRFVEVDPVDVVLHVEPPPGGVVTSIVAAASLALVLRHQAGTFPVVMGVGHASREILPAQRTHVLVHSGELQEESILQ